MDSVESRLRVEEGGMDEEMRKDEDDRRNEAERRIASERVVEPEKVIREEELKKLIVELQHKNALDKEKIEKLEEENGEQAKTIGQLERSGERREEKLRSKKKELELALDARDGYKKALGLAEEIDRLRRERGDGDVIVPMVNQKTEEERRALRLESEQLKMSLTEALSQKHATEGEIEQLEGEGKGLEEKEALRVQANSVVRSSAVKELQLDYIKFCMERKKKQWRRVNIDDPATFDEVEEDEEYLERLVQELADDSQGDLEEGLEEGIEVEDQAERHEVEEA
ncbi:hypothetical protein EJ08DRAFT_700944 [Tothia fuscella]|uniref:Uncharacterized protein n=1 Tax=Tothia fuscella TaxID=1048955 RepID=A0A9P4NJU3_9PEZI|nr:hypothetical protein EJ08DRAFT_700944 [Tothia fuscella]